jgi:hypothetical protein
MPPNGAASGEIKPRDDADHSAFESVGETPNPSNIVAKKVTGEAEFGII